MAKKGSYLFSSDEDMRCELSGVSTIKPDSSNLKPQTLHLRKYKSSVIEPVMDTKLIGAIRAFGGIEDGMMIVHGRSCCHADNLLFRWMTVGHNEIRLTGGGLRLRDISTGGAQKLGISLRASYEQFKPSFMTVLITSVPSMMGDDVEGVILKLKDKIPVPVLAFYCPGYTGSAFSGYEQALSSLCGYMDSDKDAGQESVCDGEVNLIGLKFDNPHSSSDLMEIKRMLKEHEIKVNTVFTHDKFESLKNATDAGLNVVISGDGMELAKRMEKMFDIPYKVVPYPFGLTGSVQFLESVAGALGKDLDSGVVEKEKGILKDKLEKVFGFLEGCFNLKAAVVGESGRAFDLARFLNDELCLDVKLLAVTSVNAETENMREEEYVENYLRVKDRLYLNEKLETSDVELIFGSSMEGSFCKEKAIPLIKVFYPTIDKVFISDYPIAGFRGVINLTESILNRVIDRQNQ